MDHYASETSGDVGAGDLVRRHLIEMRQDQTGDGVRRGLIYLGFPVAPAAGQEFLAEGGKRKADRGCLVIVRFVAHPVIRPAIFPALGLTVLKEPLGRLARLGLRLVVRWLEGDLARGVIGGCSALPHIEPLYDECGLARRVNSQSGAAEKVVQNDIRPLKAFLHQQAAD